MAPIPLIQLHEVRFTRPGIGGFGLRVADLAIMAGEAVACVGPSGSGKTTLLQLIAGILTPDSGRVHVLGHDLSGWSDAQRRSLRRRRIGMIFQEFELLEYVSAGRNIRLAGWLESGFDRAALNRRAGELAEVAGIAALLGRMPRTLSQGERQRVAICRALATAPPLVLGDEPTGNLDPASTAGVVSLLLGEARSRGAAVLMATHNHALLAQFDRVIDMTAFVAGGPAR